MKPLIKCFGGQFYCKDFVVSNFPTNYEEYCYGELYIGGGSVFLNKNSSINNCFEIINDLDSRLISIYKIVKDNCQDFMDCLFKLKYSKTTFEACLKCENIVQDEFLTAVSEYCIRRMSRSGLRKNFAWSERLRGGIPGDVNGWNNSIKQLPEISKKLKNTHIMNRPAIDILDFYKEYNNFLFYLDPPFLQSTRTTKNSYGLFEMSENQHIELLEMINICKGKILISGYKSNLYDKYLSNWNLATKSMPNHSGQGKKKQKRLACLWKNW